MSKETVVKRTRKQVNLATAKVADGQTRTPTSVYEIVGIPTHSYKTNHLSQYSRELSTMNLAQLHQEAYARAVLATDSRDVLVDRLEKKFIQETSKFKSASDSRAFEVEPEVPETLRDHALRILSRGR